MEMYECITRMMELSGMTFDEVLTFFLVVMVGSVSAFGFLLSTFFDLGCCLYHVVKDLFCFILCKLRHKEDEGS